MYLNNATTIAIEYNTRAMREYVNIKRDTFTELWAHGGSSILGVRKLVDHLHNHNIPLAIATSGSERISNIKTKNHVDIFSKFHHVVHGSSDPEVKNGKPHPDIYLVCSSRFPDKPSPEKVLKYCCIVNALRFNYISFLTKIINCQLLIIYSRMLRSFFQSSKFKKMFHITASNSYILKV